MVKVFSFLIPAISSVIPLAVRAQGLVPCGPGTSKPACELCDLFKLIKNIMDFLLLPPKGIVPIVAVLMIAIGGIMYMVGFGGGGGPEMISRAKKLFSSVVIGLLIAYGAWVIVNLFFQVIGVQSWTGLEQGWWKIQCQ